MTSVIFLLHYHRTVDILRVSRYYKLFHITAGVPFNSAFITRYNRITLTPIQQ